MTDSDSIRLSCPAKVNLALSVGSPDGAGMHPIASWMAAVTFGDELALSRAEGESTFDIAFMGDEEGDGGAAMVVDWPLEKDLAYRAHQLLQEHAGRPLPVVMTLRKRIPAGAGLGGGSSNAAGMMVGLNKLFALGVTTEELTDLSRRLGSDVAFAVGAMTGRASAIVTGLGEKLEDAPLREVIHLVLVLPGFGCATGAVYRAWDGREKSRRSEGEEPKASPISGSAAFRVSGSGAAPDLDRVKALAARSPLPQDGPFNDLAEAACAVEPRLAEALRRVREALQLPVHVTGSGSTMFIIAPSAITAKPLARKVTATTGYRAVATRTI